jgi:hypothetical protein
MIASSAAIAQAALEHAVARPIFAPLNRASPIAAADKSGARIGGAPWAGAAYSQVRRLLA